MGKKIEIELAFLANGDVDADQSLAVAAATISAYKSRMETQDSTIRAALDVVFDALRAGNTRANMPFVIGQVLQQLNVSADPTSYKTKEAMVRAFIKENGQGKVDKATKAQERPNSYLVVTKGKSSTGSIARRADLIQDARDAAAKASGQTPAPASEQEALEDLGDEGDADIDLE